MTAAIGMVATQRFRNEQRIAASELLELCGIELSGPLGADHVGKGDAITLAQRAERDFLELAGMNKVGHQRPGRF